ncbi:uncharacterized protein MELLADRAFT_88872 [Melampsora larici-populina 98AG31]|uniref:Helicase C-terminal domain-containing protein n=1 Tax=Melampsora larici-populina (strain 98AG31 / pathotype 3-4-7) TaxID=747676 RepID=F4R643_MELLP|nr:uncharacterized protein MELLADRAFT_88872 [Melampsora larici-populina 98AG31]EGG11820.1 hypothetical protein MELLADRAFT_88872 [Melampsora larici-populina 98AG31]
MDPSTITQMVGRAGRSGNHGLGIMFVEPNRPSGKNKISEFEEGKEMGDDERMDALAITPVCLRVALSIDNLAFRFGYIPLSVDDSRYKEEIARQQAAWMPNCTCSNCEPEGAVQLINAFRKTSKSDLSHLISTPVLDLSNPLESTLPYLWYPPKLVVSTIKPLICKKDDPIRLKEDFVELAVSLVGHFEILYRKSPLKNCGVAPDVLFNREHAWLIVKNYKLILDGLCLRKLLGSQAVPGIFQMINTCIQLWLHSDAYAHLELEMDMAQVEEDQNYLDDMLIEAEYEAEKQVQLLRKADEARAVEARKAARLEKAAEKYEKEELARESRRKKMEGKQTVVRDVMTSHEVCHFTWIYCYKYSSLTSVSMAEELNRVTSASGPPNLNLLYLFFRASSVRMFWNCVIPKV